MAAVTVLGVPTSAGAYGVGQEQAPAALRAAGLVDGLTSRGVSVVDEGDLALERFVPDPASRNAQNLGRVVAVAAGVAGRIERIVRNGRVPFVAGGDCTITLGVVAGVLAAGCEPAVAYVDGDLDMSTPATTTSGILDAMGVAHLLGLEGAAGPLASLGTRTPMLRGPDLALIGFEDIEPAEAATLDGRGVHRVPASDVRQDPRGAGRDALSALGDSRDLVVHLDVDVIDSVDLPLAHYPHFNTGVTVAQARACLETLCSAPTLSAVVVTEVNPLHDPDGVYLPALVALLVGAFAPARPASNAIP